MAYTGTHDNEPANGWFANTNEYARARAVNYLQLNETEGYNWGMLRGIWSSVADLAIVQAQDILGLGCEARMNTPSVPSGNWSWRARPGVFTRELAKKLRHLTEIYGRTDFWDAFPEESPEEDEAEEADDAPAKTTEKE